DTADPTEPTGHQASLGSTPRESTRARVQNERAQRLQTRAVHCRQQATHGTSMRQLSPLKECPKGGSKRVQSHTTCKVRSPLSAEPNSSARKSRSAYRPKRPRTKRTRVLRAPSSP